MKSLKIYLLISTLVTFAPTLISPSQKDHRTLQMEEFQPRPLEMSVTRKWDLQLLELQKARQLLEPQRTIVIAVIDTGLATEHQEFQNRLWTNPGESGFDSTGQNKATNQIDDDGNGFIDDVHGWNFVSQTHDFSDHHGHGTHVAGIATQVDPNLKIMVLKYFDPKGSGPQHLLNTIRAIEYATLMGADIINYSAGGLNENSQERAAIRRAQKKGILFVAAAGNEGSDSGLIPYYPANYNLENILSVTAINPQAQVLDSSNYNSQFVDVAAPGEDIVSALPPNRYGVLTGTSQATAFVTGIAALIMAQYKEKPSPEDVIQTIVKTGKLNPQLKNKVRHMSQLNAFQALSMRGMSFHEVFQPENIYARYLKEKRLHKLNRSPSGQTLSE